MLSVHITKRFRLKNQKGTESTTRSFWNAMSKHLHCYIMFLCYKHKWYTHYYFHLPCLKFWFLLIRKTSLMQLSRKVSQCDRKSILNLSQTKGRRVWNHKLKHQQQLLPYCVSLSTFWNWPTNNDTWFWKTAICLVSRFSVGVEMSKAISAHLLPLLLLFNLLRHGSVKVFHTHQQRNWSLSSLSIFQLCAIRQVI